ncbi:MAG: PAS domain S-box protein [Anaerolineales bacterium]|nr:PAS domain S-box protein [Anaerolineales bacterium]
MGTPLRVLILEDQISDLELTLMHLKQAGFDPAWTCVDKKEDYLAHLKDGFDIILADFKLPQFDALHALQHLKESGLDLPFIVVSGAISEEVAVQCIKMGAADYLLKDRMIRLGPAVENALNEKKLRDEQKRSHAQVRLLSSAIEQSTEGIAVTDISGQFLFANNALAGMHGYMPEELKGKNIAILYTPQESSLIESANLRALTEGQYSDETWHTRKDQTTFSGQSHISLLRDENSNPIGLIHTLRDITERKQAEEKIKQLLIDLQQKNEELAHAYDATLEGWVRFLDLRDQETEGHTQRVTEMTTELAAQMGFAGAGLLHIRRGALLHDIGKMGIPDNVLRKPGPLNNDEWEIMRRHPVYAFQMLSPIEFLHPALDIPHHHHERWDGTGYPNQLIKEEIPMPARMFAIIDVWDALNSDRPYRKAWHPEKAIDYIKSQSGKHFDPHLVQIFLDFIASKGFLHSTNHNH